METSFASGRPAVAMRSLGVESRIGRFFRVRFRKSHSCAAFPSSSASGTIVRMSVSEAAAQVNQKNAKIDPDDYRMSVGEHLEELRGRLIKSMVGFIIALGV